MTRVEDFKSGDRVIHIGCGVTRGVVTEIKPTRFGDMGVLVEFDPTPLPNYPARKWHGHYDQQWFDKYPDGLRKIEG